MMLNTQELSEKLKVTPTVIRRWERNGLKYINGKSRIKLFDYEYVCNWLKENYKIDVNYYYYDTLMTARELADEFDVHVNTIRRFVKLGMPYQRFTNMQMAFDLEDCMTWFNTCYKKRSRKQ